MKRFFLIMLGFSIMLNADFSRDNVGIVTDSTTGLEWQDNAKGFTEANILGYRINYTWIDAIEGCENLVLGSHDDWRLPTINELLTIVDDTKYSPSINTDFFSYYKLGLYWASSSGYVNNNYAWLVYFQDASNSLRRKDNSFLVRCVRGGI